MRNPFKRDPDPFAASRYSGILRGARMRHKKHMRHWWQWALLAFFLTVAGIGSYSTWLYYHTQGRFHGKFGGVDERKNELDPFNALLVGSDSRAGLTEQEQFDLGARDVGGERADTIILAHIDPGENHVTMVQFPRDLYVPIASGGSDKINAALVGGPEELIKTIKGLTGLDINQYVQVNIAGFRDLVDAIGGVDLCVPEAIPFDPHTGLEITQDEVGMVHFDGDRALRFVRSRNFVTGDFERVQNQQRFVAAAIGEITSASTLLNPSRIPKLANVAGDNLVTDQHTTILGLRSLAQRLKNFDPDHYEAYIAPNDGIGAVNGASVVLPDNEGMKIVFDAIADNESPAEADGVPAIEPSTIRVGVYNGSGVDGAASEAAEQLETVTAIGEGPVQIVDVTDAKKQNYNRTVIEYAPDAEKMGDLVAAAIPGAEVHEGPVPRGIDVEVIVGRKFATKQLIEILPIPIPRPGEVPEVCQEGAAGRAGE